MENREQHDKTVETRLGANAIGELYVDAIKYKEPTLILFIDFLVRERKVLSFDDPVEKLDYYFQDRFANKMNQHLDEYKTKREQGRE